METQTIEYKKLARRGTKDLVNKLKKKNYKDKTEMKDIFIILEKRTNLSDHGIKKEDFLPETIKITTKKMKKVSLKNPPISCEFLSIGDNVEFTNRDKAKLKGKVIKIYNCFRTKKDYVRLKSDDGRIYHKLLSYFKKD